APSRTTMVSAASTTASPAAAAAAFAAATARADASGARPALRASSSRSAGARSKPSPTAPSSSRRLGEADASTSLPWAVVGIHVLYSVAGLAGHDLGFSLAGAQSPR